MPFFLLSDTFADDPVWTVLAEGKQPLIDALQASYGRLMSKASHLTTDGYLTDDLARRTVTSRRVLTLLQMRVLGQEPLLHKYGDECECLGDEWIEGYTFRLHKFLKRNPSRREYERNRGQKADLRNARLKQLVFDRDGGCCRYCRSGVLSAKAGRSRDRRKVLHFDHVDPDQVAGEDGRNLVVACGRCNEFKGHRTPDEADMVLLAVPTDEEKAAWKAAGRQLFDLPEAPSITDEPPAEQPPITDHHSDRDGDRSRDQRPATDHPNTAEPRPEQDEQQHDQRPDAAAKGPGWVGEPPSSDTRASPSNAQPERTGDAPDIYHRRSRPAPTSPPPDRLPRRDSP